MNTCCPYIVSRIVFLWFLKMIKSVTQLWMGDRLSDIGLHDLGSHLIDFMCLFSYPSVFIIGGISCFGHGLLCPVPLFEVPQEGPGCTGATLWFCALRSCCGSVTVML